MVAVKSVHRLKVEPFGDWTDAQKERIAAAANLAPLSLFGDAAKTPAELKAPRFIARYEYYCAADGCPRHGGQILDWELTGQTSFFMGNFEDAESATASAFSACTTRRKASEPVWACSI